MNSKLKGFVKSIYVLVKLRTGNIIMIINTSMQPTGLCKVSEGRSIFQKKGCSPFQKDE